MSATVTHATRIRVIDAYGSLLCEGPLGEFFELNGIEGPELEEIAVSLAAHGSFVLRGLESGGPIRVEVSP